MFKLEYLQHHYRLSDLEVIVEAQVNKDEERLLQRVHHLRQIVTWADELQAQLGPTEAADQPNWARFEAALATAYKRSGRHQK
jgi:hypothetical protein